MNFCHLTQQPDEPGRQVGWQTSSSRGRAPPHGSASMVVVQTCGGTCPVHLPREPRPTGYAVSLVLRLSTWRCARRATCLARIRAQATGNYPERAEHGTQSLGS
jgi:hypothetical protein